LSIIVFVGPTIPVREARRVLDAVYRPPVSQGDVLGACAEGCQAIGIIDGYFERAPAVWHKEILWAMASGIHVFGAASMGALRAAELHEFGMVGVGSVFDGYLRGELEADEDVAVMHASAEHGYRPASEPLVNIRATLRKASEQGILGFDTCATLERLAKTEFYADRTYALLLEKGRRDGLSSSELAALHAWLPRHRVDQKRLDAIAMLQVMRDSIVPDTARKTVRFFFEHTDAWEHALRERVTKSASDRTT
jgi:hypothetical protein